MATRRGFLGMLAALPLLGKFLAEPGEAYVVTEDFIQAPTLHARDLKLPNYGGEGLPDIMPSRGAIGPNMIFLQTPKKGQARVGDVWVYGDHTLEATTNGWRAARPTERGR